MICTVFRTAKAEAALIEEELRRKTALATDERLVVVGLFTRDAYQRFLDGEERADVICVDVSATPGIGHAEALRRRCPAAAIMLLADVKTPPTAYMKPTILAAALLLKPLSVETVRGVVEEVFRCFLEKEPDDGSVFLVETREGKERIPWSDILYFEARAKKIYACTADSEYGFYDTMDALEERLKDRFVRCHRSYLANRKLIEKVRLSQNFITLQGDVELPLSRSYKGVLKEMK